MKLTLVSPTYTREIKIAWLEINTDAGNFVIQPGHAPMIVILAHNKRLTYCADTGKQESIVIQDGIADIARDGATIIINDTVQK